MDIPFDINDAENAASDMLEIDDIQEADAVRISASNLHAQAVLHRTWGAAF